MAMIIERFGTESKSAGRRKDDDAIEERSGNESKSVPLRKKGEYARRATVYFYATDDKCLRWHQLKLNDDDDDDDAPLTQASSPPTVYILDRHVSVNSVIYSIGAMCCINHQRPLNDVYMLDTCAPGSGSEDGLSRWVRGPNMNVGRTNPKAVVVGGKIYVFGGFGNYFRSGHVPCCWVEFLDPKEENCWKFLNICDDKGQPLMLLLGMTDDLDLIVGAVGGQNILVASSYAAYLYNVYHNSLYPLNLYPVNPGGQLLPYNKFRSGKRDPVSVCGILFWLRLEECVLEAYLSDERKFLYTNIEGLDTNLHSRVHTDAYLSYILLRQDADDGCRTAAGGISDGIVLYVLWYGAYKYGDTSIDLNCTTVEVFYYPAGATLRALAKSTKSCHVHPHLRIYDGLLLMDI